MFENEFSTLNVLDCLTSSILKNGLSALIFDKATTLYYSVSNEIEY